MTKYMLYGAADYQGQRLNFTFYLPLENPTKEEAEAAFITKCQQRGYENPVFEEWGSG